MGGGEAALTLGPQGVYRRSQDASFAVTIESPVDGFATIILFPDGAAPKVYPDQEREPKEPAIRVVAREARQYGRFRPPQKTTVLLVVATRDSSTEVVSKVVKGLGPLQQPPEEEIARSLDEIQEALQQTGDRLVATGRFTVEPSPKGAR
jgi:hypothetical protein